MPQLLDAVLAAFGLPSPASVTRAPLGVLNEVSVLRYDDQAWVLKRYRHADAQRVAREIAVMERGRRLLPVPQLRATLEGGWLCSIEGAICTLQEHASGTQHSRRDLSPSHALAMGRAMGLLHREFALDDLEVPTYGAPRPIKEVLCDIEQLLALVPAADEVARSHLLSRQAWLSAQLDDFEAAAASLLTSRISLHGDFTDVNLFFEGDAVTAVLDWELAMLGPAQAEFFRTAHFCFDDRVPLWVAFLEGYRREHEVTADGLDAGAELFATHRARGLWEFDAVYREGNDRARQYLVSPVFRPWTERWATLRPHLT